MMREVPRESEIVRYSLADRIMHWFTAVTFIYLMLSGFALGYPRMAWLYDVLGGGQTVRWLHPWAGVAFTIGIAYMLFAWTRDMLFEAEDRRWAREFRNYARTGHVDADVGRYNAGQKGYYWFALGTGLILLLTGIPLWYPWLLGSGWNLTARLVHHAFFLLTVGGFIIHVYMSTALLPGTVRGMTTGRVERRWAAWHHPRWFREQEAPQQAAAPEQKPAVRT
ncbi:MAG TPA: formate dehydrogenase subunit gamma [Actinomycetota bacterium]|nr:formate dehydrogenase subunit gamma [Actinomycetota bacterium]